MPIYRETSEQALRVDRPPSSLSCATPSSLPATQGQRSIKREGNHPHRASIDDLNPLLAPNPYSLQHLLHTYS